MRGLFVLVSSLFDLFKYAIVTLPFIPVSSTVLQAPCNFFDPHDELLKQLFKSQAVFPGLFFSSLYSSTVWIKRYYLYHRDRYTTDLTSIQVYSRTSLAISSEVNISRVVAGFCYLNKYPNVLNKKSD